MSWLHFLNHFWERKGDGFKVKWIDGRLFYCQWAHCDVCDGWKMMEYYGNDVINVWSAWSKARAEEYLEELKNELG